MSPENNPDIERLAAVEKIIIALESLVSECQTRDLTRLAKHIGDCTVKCQGEYVAFHRRVYRHGGSKPAPPDTEH